MKILYVASEAYPYVSTGGLAEVAGALPRAIGALGQDVRLILPLYSCISDEYRARMRLVRNISFSVSFTQYSCGLYALQDDDCTVYFVENPDFFDRDCIYGDTDDAARFAFFSRAVVALLPILREAEQWQPDLLHCNDWQTALIPIYLREAEQISTAFPELRIIYSIHNAEYPITSDLDVLNNDFGLSGALFADGVVEFEGHIDLLKGALLCADAITTFSPTYAAELLADGAAFALSPILRAHRDKLHGILNGIDTTARHPAHNPNLPCPYDCDSLGGRLENKRALQAQLGFPVSDETPLLACISRLLPRKGYDLLLQILPELMALGAQVVILGAGVPELEQKLGQFETQYPQQYHLQCATYDEVLADRIYGACDLFLAPSQSEPCGLPVMRAMSCGAIPVVRATGGLKDTVVPYDAAHGTGYGFTFDAYTPEAFLGAVRAALDACRQPALHEKLCRRCMQQDFSWNTSAQAYLELYRSLF